MQPLPLELYRLILQYVVSRRDLLRLLYVSHFFRDEAERVLYCNLQLYHLGTNRVRQDLALLHSLVTCDRLASRVRTLDVTAASEGSPPSSQQWHLLHQAFCAVQRLKRLTLHIDSAFMIDFSLLSGCTFQLRQLDISGLREIDRSALEGQKDIVDLHIRDSDALTYSKTAFPNLSLLAAGSSHLPELLSGRSVKAVHWVVTNRLPLQSFKSVCSLYISVSASLPFSDIPLHFPSLRYFRLEYLEEEPLTLANVLASCHGLSLHTLSIKMLQPSFHWVSTIFSAVRSLHVLQLRAERAMAVEWVRGVEIGVTVEWGDNEWKDARWH